MNKGRSEATDDSEDGLWGFVFFVVGVISMFLVVGAIATLIVLGVDDRHSIVSLTSTHPVKPLSPTVRETIQHSSVSQHSSIIGVKEDTETDINEELDLLLLVRSLPEDLASRDMIRNTWMKDLPSRVEVLFSIPAQDATPIVLEAMNHESSTHRDMVIFLASPVTPESESLMLELLWSVRARKFAYLMKTRDSMYVRLDILMKDVIQPMKTTNSNAYLGYFQGKQKPKDIKSTKLSEPEWYLCDYFIRFAHSGGYILSNKLVERLSAQVHVLYPYNNEDVALGTWLSPYDDISWTHSIEFNTEVGRSRGCWNNFIVFPSTDMMTQHTRLSNGEPVCELEHEAIETYQYDFKTAPSKCCTAVKLKNTV